MFAGLQGLSGAPKSRPAQSRSPKSQTLENYGGSGCTGVQSILGKPRTPILLKRRSAGVGSVRSCLFSPRWHTRLCIKAREREKTVWQ